MYAKIIITFLLLLYIDIHIFQLNHNILLFDFLRCEELFHKQENIKNYNLSLKILKAQFGENPDTTLLPDNNNLVEDIQKVLDVIEW